LPLGAVIFDVPTGAIGDARISYANAKASEDSRLDMQQLVGRSLREAMPSDYGSEEPAYAEVLRRLSESDGHELVDVDRGERGEFEIHYASLGDRRVAAIYLNVTARKQAESAVRQRESLLQAGERFRLLISAVKDYAIFMLDETGRVASWNAGAERIKGYAAEEIIGQHFSVFYSAQDLLSGKPARELDVATAEGRYEEESWRVRKDGSRFAASVVITAVRDPSGKLIGFAKVTRDITERLAAEAALKLANQELEAFSYSVAHDLRAPLRGMNGFAQVLLDTYRDQFDAEGRDCLEEIRLNARKMGELIDALLGLSRVARSELKSERIDFSALVRVAARELAAAEPERKIELSVEAGLALDADPRLLRTLLDNLLGNAWKFTRKQSFARIEVGRSEIEGAPTFFVRDNGAGFEMAFSGKLFAPFQRLHTTSEFPGTGIGLATVQRIVRRHGGRIWAEGELGRGATFYFTLPEPRS
jgi:PAS domain S-box-containing protein